MKECMWKPARDRVRDIRRKGRTRYMPGNQPPLYYNRIACGKNSYGRADCSAPRHKFWAPLRLLRTELNVTGQRLCRSCSALARKLVDGTVRGENKQ